MTDSAKPVKFIEEKSKWVLLFWVVGDDCEGGSVREVAVVVVVEKWWLVKKSEKRERTCLM